MRTITKEQLVKTVTAAMMARDSADKQKTKSGRVTSNKLSGTTLINFQKSDGTLTPDGFYGPNVVAALTWYLQKAKNPKVTKADAKYDHIAVSWEPPSLYEPSKPSSAAVMPTPKPVSSPAPISSASASPAPAPAPGTSSKSRSKKRTVPSTPAYGQELHTIKPKHDAEEHVAAHATGKKVPKTKSHDAEDIIATKAAASSQPQLQKIHKMMIKKALQEQATGEHKSLNKESDWKKNVLARLDAIQKRIDKGGSNLGTTQERRIVGLVL